MSKCSECGCEKSIDDYYKFNKYTCKECVRAKVRKWSENNREKRKIISKRYVLNNPEKRKITTQKYYQNNKEKLYLSKKIWESNNRDKVNRVAKESRLRNIKQSKCRDIFNDKVRRGLINKQSCIRCGELKAEAHHPNYNKPLDVMWLCRKCHVFWHKHNKPIF